MSDFVQDPPRLGNQYLEDLALQEYLQSFMGNFIKEYQSELTKFGERVVADLIPHHRLCEKFPPVFEEYSAWGEKIDKIYTHSSWGYMHKVSCEERLIRLGYLDIPCNRLLQFAKLYLFNPSSGLYMCPLAMTDGAGYLIKHRLEKDQEIRRVFEKITSEDPGNFWTCGQWMTEKHGGSDVSAATRTQAVHIEGDKYALFGYKWFTSATTAQAAFTLARVDGKLSIFLVLVQENIEKIKIVRLKEKLGTKQLPTAEMKLEGCIGKLVAPIGEGIRYIASLVNITRLHNSIGAISSMRRAVAIARDYSFRRFAFGKSIAEHPLHQNTLFLMEVKTRGCLIFLLYTASLLEKVEKSTAQPWEVETLRILTPVIKLYTGKICTEVIKEGMECIGGVGYMENSGIPNLLRDAEVYSIWEGTTNVLSLDVIRVIAKNKDYKFEVLQQAIQNLSGEKILIERIKKLEKYVKISKTYRKVAFEIGHVIIAALLIWHAGKSGNEQSREIAGFWMENFKENFVEASDDLMVNLAHGLKNLKPTGMSNIGVDGAPRYKI